MHKVCSMLIPCVRHLVNSLLNIAKSPTSCLTAESTSSGNVKKEVVEMATRARRTKKQTDDTEDESSDIELGDRERDSWVVNIEDEQIEDLVLQKDGEHDIKGGCSPLVCCFGATQHLFVPSGRKANRLVDYEIQERLKHALWIPENYVRAPGGCASDVAVALARLGGKVAFMGKIGDDDYGQSFVNYLNVHNVQTRSVCIDRKRVTAASRMKIGKRGGLKTTCVKPCAEDSLSRSEINIDVLREVRYSPLLWVEILVSLGSFPKLVFEL